MVGTVAALGATVLALAATTLVGLRYAHGRATTAESLVSARGFASEGMTSASVVASVMGAWILLSPAEAGAAFGGLPAILGYALGSAVPLALFVPVGARIRQVMPDGHSLTEYVLARFGRWFYGFVLLVSLLYMFVFLAAEMTGISLALSLVAGVPAWMTALVVGGFVLVYTAYGGLVASLVTDTIQTVLLLPLLALGFGGAVLALGGPTAIHGEVAATSPALLDPANPSGVVFGIYVVFAVLGANMLNQGMWQRVWAADSTAAIRRSFAVAAVAVVPMVLLAGLFGVAAAGLGLAGDTPGIAFFLVLDAAFPEWVVLVVVVVATLLVASSADTMLNAIASLVTTDLARVLDDPDDATLSGLARGLTVVVAAGAIVVGAQGYGVLTLFLLADLLGAAVFAPFVLGLWLPSLTERTAVVAGVAGLAVGLAFFPPLRALLVGVGLEGLPAPSFLHAFVGATGVSVLVTVVGAAASSTAFPVERLNDATIRLGGERR